MYECLALDDTPTTQPAASERRFNFDPYRATTCLRLHNTARPPSLLRARAAASNLQLKTQAAADGSVLILALDLETALLFQRQFPDLLATYEPARPIPR